MEYGQIFETLIRYLGYSTTQINIESLKTVLLSKCLMWPTQHTLKNLELIYTKTIDVWQKIRIDSTTLVEMEDVTTLQIGKQISKCIGRHRYNKVVINYEVTNVAEVEQGITEDKQRKQSKDLTKELLQQFVVPTKGD